LGLASASVPAILCYTISMIRKSRRRGATQTFSVSVDPETKKALRALADREFGGNLSALIADLAEDARRRMQAAGYLRRHGETKLTKTEVEELEAQINAEIAAWKKSRRKPEVA